jgi:ketoreductase RED2
MEHDVDQTDHQSRRALVVGGTSGIGHATARALGERGWQTVISGSRDVEQGVAIAADLPGAHYARADIGLPESPRELVAEAVARLGGLDAVVYTAGATERIPHADLDAATDEVWERILRMNLLAPWRLVVAAAPHLRASQNATITVVGALAGVDVGGSSIPYAVSKAGLHHMVKLLGAVLGPEIRINAVAPGLIETSWTSGDGWDALYEHIRLTTPLQRVGRPEDVAALITGLMSSPYTTGQTVVADGGLSLVP